MSSCSRSNRGSWPNHSCSAVSVGFDAKLVKRSPTQMTSLEQQLVADRLGPVCTALGYE